MNKLAVLEGLLFIMGDEGVSLEDISENLEISKEETQKLLTELQNEYNKDSHGIRISLLGGKFKMTTKKEHKEYYQKFLASEKNNILSQAALETLAIIAYNQPITRAEVDEARGIASINMIRKLVARDLIKVSGKSSLPGRPNLYRTTNLFLDYFGLTSLDDLPKIEDLKDDNEEKDLFTSNYKEQI